MFNIFKKNDSLLRFRVGTIIITILGVTTLLFFSNFPRDAISQFGTVGDKSWYLMDNDFETLTVGTSTAIGFGSIKITHPETARVRFRVEDNNIRIRTDGTDPTSAVGELVKADDSYQVIGYENITNFKAIAVTGTAILPSTYAVEKGMK